MPLNELLKLYSKNPPSTSNENVSPDEEVRDNLKYFYLYAFFSLLQSFSSSELEDDDDDEEDEDDEDHRRHHLLHMNGELLPENDDEDTEDSLYEPEVIKVYLYY